MCHAPHAVQVKKISVLERDKRHQLMNDIKVGGSAGGGAVAAQQAVVAQQARQTGWPHGSRTCGPALQALCNAPLMDGLIRFFGAYHAADRGQIAVVLEYMDGGSLADVVQKVRPGWLLRNGVKRRAARGRWAAMGMHTHTGMCMARRPAVCAVQLHKPRRPCLALGCPASCPPPLHLARWSASPSRCWRASRPASCPHWPICTPTAWCTETSRCGTDTKAAECSSLGHTLSCVGLLFQRCSCSIGKWVHLAAALRACMPLQSHPGCSPPTS